MRNQAFVYLLLLSVLSSAYSDYSFEASVKVNDDGSAHVTEKTVFIFENTEERKAFEFNMNLGESTILEWRKFSGNIKYHVKGSTNVRITAKREFAVSFDAGAVIVEYETPDLFANFSVGSRRTVYFLVQDSLAFDRTKTGQMSMGNNMRLLFEFPKDAELLKVSPLNERKDNIVLWEGPLTGNWEFEYAREIPLSQEVGDFFLNTYRRASEYLPLLLLGAFSLLVLFVLVKFGRK